MRVGGLTFLGAARLFGNAIRRRACTTAAVQTTKGSAHVHLVGRAATRVRLRAWLGSRCRIWQGGGITLCHNGIRGLRRAERSEAHYEYERK